MAWLERLLTWLGVERHDIGRDGIGTYLTRWVLAGWRGRDGQRRYGDGQKVFLHLFHRGDVEDYAHDHPWPFWSLILWGGYFEITGGGPHCPSCNLDCFEREGRSSCCDVEVLSTGERRKWYGPLRLLRRPAEWQHRVELPEGKRCWSILWIGRKQRSWGFICPGKGWIPWRQHEANQSVGKPGCGE